MIEKIYPQSTDYVLNTINDIVELQNAKLTFSDTPNGRIHFLVRMYAYKYELQFNVTSVDENSSKVSFAIAGEELGRDNILCHEITLFESMLNPKVLAIA